MLVRPLILAAVTMTTACARDGDAASTFSGGSHVGTGEPASSSTGRGNTSSGDVASSGETSGISGDVSTGTAGGTSSGSPVPDLSSAGPEGCHGKIDFLFVISSSGSMTPVQDRVHAALPEFIAAIESEFVDFDRHIMVVETDKNWYMGDCSLCGPGCDPNGELPTCGAELDACDNTMGAGVNFPAGKDSSARRCELTAGRYITREDPDPVAAFLCTAKVGSGGSIPHPADAMVAALGPALLGLPPYPPMGCNLGFLRDDALLVVTIISDTADDESSGPAEAWRDALMAAKNQDGDAFQLLVITTDKDVHDGLCDADTWGWKHRLRIFSDIVPHGLFGSICAESYAPFFDLAVAEILERCASYVPQ